MHLQTSVAITTIISVQINDISYVYQALGPAPAPGGLSVEHDSGMQSDGKFPTGHAVKPNGAGIAKGAVDKSVLDIVFPDVTKKDGTLLTDIEKNQDPAEGVIMQMMISVLLTSVFHFRLFRVLHKRDYKKFQIFTMVLFS